MEIEMGFVLLSFDPICLRQAVFNTFGYNAFVPIRAAEQIGACDWLQLSKDHYCYSNT